MMTLQQYFIPHRNNDYKPHLLRTEATFGLLALIVVIEIAFLSQALFLGKGTGFLALVLPNSLIDQTNQSRVAANLQPLTENPLLTAAAQRKANDMAAKGYFAHTSPEGVTPWYWFQQVGYKYTYAGENLAVNFSDSRDVENAWMNSPDHRANIMNGNYTQIGIATAQGTYQGQPTVFVVQLFGRPPAAKPAPAPAVVTVTPQPTPLPTPVPAFSPTPIPSLAPTPSTAPTNTPTPLPSATPTPVVSSTPIPVPVVTVQPNPTSTEPVAAPTPIVPPAEAADNQQNSVAVEGVSTVVAPAAAKPTPSVPATDTETRASTTIPVAGQAANNSDGGAQSNPIQRIFAAPRLTANVIYIVLGVLVILALLLNVFVKMNVQHPQLVLNGLMVLLALATLTLFNQQVLLAHAKIF